MSFRARGWLTAAAIVVLGSVEQRMGKDEHDDKDPYSPPTNIAR